MFLLINVYLPLVVTLVGSALFLHLLPHLGKRGQQLADALTYAPAIDLVLIYFMIMPLIFGSFVARWSGLGTALVAEFSTLGIWIVFHETIHYKQRQQPKISRTASRLFGGWRNHLAIWITILAIPCFWTVRFAEVVAYPPLTWLVGMPKYNARDWVNVSRQKFEGLIGYDLIWCLYCDWMTGVWSLGTEMLRNVESFWCPIRFYSDKKCENCQIDFPDIENGWVAADGNMSDVVRVLEDKYSHGEKCAWFGHQSRLKDENS